MTGKANSAASIRQRLLNLARERHEDFQQMLVNYALERLLYRLAQSVHRERFVLKGALLFRLWFDLTQRPTRDADFLGFGEADPEHCAAVFRQIVSLDMTADDGLVFDTGSVRAVEIRKEAGYPRGASQHEGDTRRRTYSRATRYWFWGCSMHYGLGRQGSGDWQNNYLRSVCSDGKRAHGRSQ